MLVQEKNGKPGASSKYLKLFYSEKFFATFWDVFHIAPWINYYCRSISLNTHMNYGRNYIYSFSRIHANYTYFAFSWRVKYPRMPAQLQAHHPRSQGSDSRGIYWSEDLFPWLVGFTEPWSWVDAELPLKAAGFPDLGSAAWHWVALANVALTSLWLVDSQDYRGSFVWDNEHV